MWLLKGVARRRAKIATATSLAAVLAAGTAGAVVIAQPNGDRLVAAETPSEGQAAADWHYWIRPADQAQDTAVHACIAQAGAQPMSASFQTPPTLGTTVNGRDNNTGFRECLTAIDGITVSEHPLATKDGTAQEPVPVEVLTADYLFNDVLSVDLDACLSRTVQVEADETATAIRLRAEVIEPTQAVGSDHCTDVVQVFLKAPLANRRIEDALTGTTLTIPNHFRGSCFARCLNDPTANPPDRGPRAPAISIPRIPS